MPLRSHWLPDLTARAVDNPRYFVGDNEFEVLSALKVTKEEGILELCSHGRPRRVPRTVAAPLRRAKGVSAFARA